MYWKLRHFSVDHNKGKFRLSRVAGNITGNVNRKYCIIITVSPNCMLLWPYSVVLVYYDYDEPRLVSKVTGYRLDSQQRQTV
jgi:hypothetical protein